MKTILKILLAPLRLALWLISRLLLLVTFISSYAFGVASALVGVLAVIVFLTSSVKNGLILFGLAVLISPVGLPMLAVKLAGLLGNLVYVVGDFTSN